eukprot:990885-Prymnesium_polylepis.2
MINHLSHIAVSPIVTVPARLTRVAVGVLLHLRSAPALARLALGRLLGRVAFGASAWMLPHWYLHCERPWQPEAIRQRAYARLELECTAAEDAKQVLQLSADVHSGEAHPLRVQRQREPVCAAAEQHDVVARGVPLGGGLEPLQRRRPISVLLRGRQARRIPAVGDRHAEHGEAQPTERRVGVDPAVEKVRDLMADRRRERRDHEHARTLTREALEQPHPLARRVVVARAPAEGKAARQARGGARGVHARAAQPPWVRREVGPREEAQHRQLARTDRVVDQREVGREQGARVLRHE